MIRACADRSCGARRRRRKTPINPMSAAATRFGVELTDRYTVLREIGAGGVATALLALDIRYAQPVAIMVLRPEFAH